MSYSYYFIPLQLILLYQYHVNRLYTLYILYIIHYVVYIM